ncbi:cytochrome c-type biogenesis protein CcmH [Flavobacteriaceae bacterium]|nr:cytochrome c-type biogenesis protein CcmH [Flavobacteriaceae bacterium]
MNGKSLIVTLLLLASMTASAVIETYVFSEPGLERRYRQLSQELRCPKCQNQNIADSNAPISRDLRSLLHRQLETGASDEEILTFMVARYGEFVRYSPAVNKKTALLWYAPGILIAFGMLGLFFHLRGRNRYPAPAGMSEQERVLLAERLQDHNE